MSEDEKAKGRGSHAKTEEVPEYMKRSKRMRRILIAVIVVLVLLLSAGGVLIYLLIDTAHMAATQQTQETAGSLEEIAGADAANDASTTTTRRTVVPNLIELLGMNLDQAVETLQHGAQVETTTEVNEEGNPVKQQVRVALTAEPSDTRSGTPTVFLSLDEAGAIVQAGYSVATASIGYGSLSFADAIQNESIIEKTLEEAGLAVVPGSVVLPESRASYSTYASDGTTLTREYCSFEGTGNANGVELTWSAALSYDYSLANATGNLTDTIRTVYIYINAPQPAR